MDEQPTITPDELAVKLASMTPQEAGRLRAMLAKRGMLKHQPRAARTYRAQRRNERKSK